jgi:NADH-quinone oxidoreductase subunit N
MNQFISLSPFWIVALGLLLLMLSDAFAGVPASPRDNAEVAKAERTIGLSIGTAVVMFAGACFALAMGLSQSHSANSLGVAQIALDSFAYFFICVLCVLSGLASLLGGAYLSEHRIHHTEFFLLLGWSTLGAMALVSAADLMTLFVALETLSLGTYCMVGMRRTPRAMEAALKYFLLGSFSSALLLFGSALLYGATGHTDFAGIAEQVRQVSEGALTVPLLAGGTVLLLAGLMFKIAAVPFHAWTPDAYEGAPTPATVFMAAVVKTAAFGLLLRVLLVALPDPRLMSWGAGWTGCIATIAVITMSVANLIASRQSSVKRMLAYSSIAHAGYALIGVASLGGSSDAQASVSLYIVAYAISTVGAFGTLIWAGSYQAEAVSYADLAGLGRRKPALALAFSLFVLSLAGIPPTAGFFGKLTVFRAAVDANLLGLAIIGLVNSVIASYYYLKVLVVMYMQEPEEGVIAARPLRSALLGTALVVAALLVLVLGIFPETILNALAHTPFAGPTS